MNNIWISYNDLQVKSMFRIKLIMKSGPSKNHLYCFSFVSRFSNLHYYIIVINWCNFTGRNFFFAFCCIRVCCKHETKLSKIHGAWHRKDWLSWQTYLLSVDNLFTLAKNCKKKSRIFAEYSLFSYEEFHICESRSAKITLGIKISWKFIWEGVNKGLEHCSAWFCPASLNTTWTSAQGQV